MNAKSEGLGWQEIVYAVLALAGLAGTWAQGIGYLELGFAGGTVQFWKDAFASPAATFLAVDVLILGAAVYLWIFSEGRRVGIAAGWLWACLLCGLLIAISFAVPAFLALRHRKLRRERPQDLAAPSGSGRVAVAIVASIALLAVAWSLGHPY
jgi:uncharacterized membrane protein